MKSGLRTTERTAACEPACDDFKVVMRRLAGGVAVITVGNDPDITGFTATSVISLSANPARLLVSVGLESDSWKMLQRFPYYGVNLLRETILNWRTDLPGAPGSTVRKDSRAGGGPQWSQARQCSIRHWPRWIAKLKRC